MPVGPAYTCACPPWVLDPVRRLHPWFPNPPTPGLSTVGSPTCVISPNPTPKHSILPPNFSHRCTTPSPPLPSRGMHPPSLQPPPIPQTTAIAHPTHSPTPTQPHVQGSTRLHECVSDLECCTQPAQDPVHLGEGGEGVEHQGLSHVCGIPQHFPQPTPQETHRMAAKALDGDCICPRAPASTPNAQPHTHTAAPSNGVTALWLAAPARWWPLAAFDVGVGLGFRV